MEGSVSFDRAAAIYDRTRVTDAEQLVSSLDLLDDTLPAGPALEIGVGTGALAVPLADRGRAVTGVDVSVGMLTHLLAKEGGEQVGVTIGDATRLPFGDHVFAGSYCRWVLHLIRDWPAAVAELCRVSRGCVLIEPGGYGGEWRTVYLRCIEEFGDAAAPIGLDFRNGNEDLDEVMRACGAALRTVRELPADLELSLGSFLQGLLSRSYSWTWRIPDEDLGAGVEVLRAWATERYGPDLDTPLMPRAPFAWRIYDLA